MGLDVQEPQAGSFGCAEGIRPYAWGREWAQEDSRRRSGEEEEEGR